MSSDNEARRRPGTRQGSCRRRRGAVLVGSLGKSRERVGGFLWWGWMWEDPDEDAGESGGGG